MWNFRKHFTESLKHNVQVCMQLNSTWMYIKIDWISQFIHWVDERKLTTILLTVKSLQINNLPKMP